ncbi:NAD-dependent epimerase/dehydratase family protein [Marinilactibacillus sp. XAAS-LB27]|uniref:NAD-dependent epimerase/dehydratase family protein n=1 Tax=Marinilactibacillus sp. XAAS-LB27 TaxID=3114538 RepID=UPI002E17F763|nr:NAD-dependent epimerase/dehydratase family protein [Marinilactibacillus sp. XAAS-LB27]
MKKILITGINSYIGNSLESKLKTESTQYEINKISLKDGSWEKDDFTIYDSLVHVAGIAHVSTDPDMEQTYYKVNRDLTIEIAEKAKLEGVKQFIFLSSIIVFGNDATEVISKETIPKPDSFYGNSKLQAEEQLIKLESEDFKICIVRPPMIYGKNSKGNYLRLSKLAKTVPLFPKYENKRSMLFIENLTEFLKLMIDNNESGIFHPQNQEYTNTSELVTLIAEVHGKKLLTTKMFNKLITIFKNNSTMKKVFGNFVYDYTLSYYKEEYCKFSLEESIKSTES